MSEFSNRYDVPTSKKKMFLTGSVRQHLSLYVYFFWTQVCFEKLFEHYSAPGFRFLIGWGGPSGDKV